MFTESVGGPFAVFLKVYLTKKRQVHLRKLFLSFWERILVYLSLLAEKNPEVKPPGFVNQS
ncbi:hypothetical protein SAMN05661091_4051 [Paenibacillus uliginis N3/975]|uniref:Uncharacterized protein n=1 Tax=Paenibacillus uliginis N3/975 TaxID=1313296 RepID=A0A1X7HK29_9BACL|nr:hypothetical protein SAMN05661091_4051 [Paenibacillus uliginis N3/975]